MTVAEILTQVGEREEFVLREHATLLALSKISRYEAECNMFRAKYSENFESFQARIERMQNEEDFEADDDLMEWQFANRALILWQERVREICRAG